MFLRLNVALVIVRSGDEHQEETVREFMFLERLVEVLQFLESILKLP